MPRIYKSKREIFKDYQVAVKFRLRYDVPPQRYEEFFAALRRHHNWRLVEFSREVAHLDSHYPISVGLFVEFPVETDDGSIVGGKFVLLEYESGPEFFLQIDPHTALVAIGTWLGMKMIEKIDEKVTDRVFHRLMQAVREHWPRQAFRIEEPFIYVEIRTEKKGVMRIKLEDFTPTQLTCLVRRFSRIKHLSDANRSCFDNKLFEPNDGWS
jgi:hypothetical protein